MKMKWRKDAVDSMLEFGRDLEDFIKENFFRKNILDNGFLEELRQVALLKRENSYIKEIKSKLILLNEIATRSIYHTDENIIDIYRINSIINYLKAVVTKDLCFSEDLYRISLFTSILHEIMHSYHLDMYLNDKRDLSHLKIIRDSLTVGEGDVSLNGKKITESKKKRADKLYSKYYFYFPEERHAELSALFFIYDIYKQIRPNNIDLLYNFYSYIIGSNLEEYIFKDKLNSPVRQFYRHINRIDLFNKLDFDGYSLKDKFIFGMPLKREEMFKVCYPFVVFNDLGEIFFEEEDVARKKWEKKYVK